MARGKPRALYRPFSPATDLAIEARVQDMMAVALAKMMSNSPLSASLRNQSPTPTSPNNLHPWDTMGSAEAETTHKAKGGNSSWQDMSKRELKRKMQNVRRLQGLHRCASLANRISLRKSRTWKRWRRNLQRHLPSIWKLQKTQRLPVTRQLELLQQSVPPAPPPHSGTNKC